MKTLYKHTASKIYGWLKNMPTTQDSSHLINLIALIRVCTISAPELKAEFNEIVYNLLQNGPKIDYPKSELIVSLLACDLILEIGNPEQVQQARSYSLLLKELWKEGAYQTNTGILQAIFSSNVENKKVEHKVRLERFTKNIDAEIIKLIEGIEKNSSYGLHPISTDDFSILKVESFAIRAIKEYNIPLAMRCLRARNYLSQSESLLMNTSIDFIESQQCYDGSFGDYDADVLKIKNAAERRLSLIKIKTIVSFQVSWFLLEMNKINLFSSLLFLNRNGNS